MKNLRTLGIASAIIAGLSLSATAMAPDKDLVDIAAGNKDFSTLVSLVKKAGLVETLKGKGPFTIFAPTNDAFKKLPKATLDAVMADDELLKNVLLYHVVPGKVMAKDVVNVRSAKTALNNGEATISVMVKDGKVYLNESVRVIKTDIGGTNGVIHVIDNVLVPPMQMASTKSGSCCAAGK